MKSIGNRHMYFTHEKNKLFDMQIHICFDVQTKRLQCVLVFNY